MSDITSSIRRADIADIATRQAELLRELCQHAEHKSGSARVATIAPYEMAWEQAMHAVELCRRAAELAARL